MRKRKRREGGKEAGGRVGKDLRHLVDTFTVLLRIEAARRKILHIFVGSVFRLGYY